MDVKITGLSGIGQAAAEVASSPIKVLMNFLTENYPDLLDCKGLTNQKKLLHIGNKVTEARTAGKPLPTKADLDYGLKQIEADGLKFQRELDELSYSGKARVVPQPTVTTGSPTTQAKTTGITSKDLNVATRPGNKAAVPGLDSTADDIAKSVKSTVTTPAPSPIPTAEPRPVTSSQVSVKSVGGVNPNAAVTSATTTAKSSTPFKTTGEEITVITKKTKVTTSVVAGATESGSVTIAKSLTASESGIATAANSLKNFAINKVEPVLAKVGKASKVLGPLGFSLDAAAMVIAVHNSENSKGQELFKYTTRTAGMVVGAKLGSAAAKLATIETGPGSLVAGAAGGAAGGIYGYVEGENYGEENFKELPKGVQDMFDGIGQGVSDVFDGLISVIENNATPEAIQVNVNALKETIGRILPFVSDEKAARLTATTPDSGVSLETDGMNSVKAVPQDTVKVYTGQGIEVVEGRKSDI